MEDESGDEYMESGEEDFGSNTNSGEDSGDEGIGGSAPTSVSNAGAHKAAFHYEILEPEEIRSAMEALVSQVREISELPNPTCRLLLNAFRWNVEKTIEGYTEDPDRALRKALGEDDDQMQAASLRAVSSSSSAGALASPSDPLVCEVCMDRADSEAGMFGLGCVHRFCRDCWRAYLRQKIVGEGVSGNMACPGVGCGRVLGEERVLELTEGDDELRRVFLQLLSNSFVEASPNLRWCPRASSECGRAVRVRLWEAGEVLCRCGRSFCFGCGEEWHEPVSCPYLRAWLKKCSDDSETSNWIAANTKECPKCRSTIEKDGGCNHMTCKSCKYEWCWVCSGPWEPHGSAWYACNRFEDGKSKEARTAQDKGRQALLRYLHYFNRYHNHRQSLALESKLYAKVKGKMEEMQAANMSWIEVQFLKTAVDKLSVARRTLCYTYVFAFYLCPNNQATIFEGNQADLELATEQLSEFLEQDLENENLISLKQRVQDKARYCEQRQTTLLEHCQSGLDEDLWRFTEV